MSQEKRIKSPEQMWDLFEQYRKNCKDNPFKLHDFVGKDGMEVYRFKERPLTVEGFQNYCFKEIGGVEQYFLNVGGAYNEFLGICKTIKATIRQEQIEGGMAGLYNASITQRLNNLVEKSEQTIDAKVTTANFGSTIIPATSKPSEGSS